MGAIIRLTLSFFISLFVHLLLVAAIWWLARDLTQHHTQIEPKAMVLDLAMFAENRVRSSGVRVQETENSGIIKQDKDPEQPHQAETDSKIKKLDSPLEDVQKLSQKPVAKTTQELEQKAEEKLPQPEIAPAIIKPTKTTTPKKKIVVKNKKHKIVTRKKKSAHTSNVQGQRKYIRHNLGRVMSISQRTLLKLGIPKVKTHKKSARTTASFTLHPNGSISGLHLTHRSGIKPIDRRSLQVIRQAHKRYPRPKVPVRVNITMRYDL